MSNSASQITPNKASSGAVFKLGLGGALGFAPLLEQRIAVYAEANTDKQADAAQEGGILDPLNSKAVAEVYGYGSPAHLVALKFYDELAMDVQIRFVFVPESGTGTATSIVLTGTGATVTKTGTLILNINGWLLSIGLVKDDTLAESLAVIKTAINAEVNLPCLVSTAVPATFVDIDSKWLGQSSIGLDVSVYSNTSEGITFAEVQTDGTGEVIPTTELAKIVNDWYPHLLNCLGNGAANAILDEFETFNGTPLAGSGKYAPENMTPLVAWTGTHTEVLATLTGVTSSRLDENTNNYFPVPKSQGFTFVDAADALGRFVKKSNGDPKQDILEDVLAATPPEDGDVGDIIDPNFRESLVDNGCSTVNFKEGNYYAGDVITTYHPSGESDPIFRYVRDMMLIFNILDQFKKLNAREKNKTIAPNATAGVRITSPELYKAKILNEIINPFVDAGYIADLDYAKEKLNVGINPTNAGRFDVLSPNLITSLLRIVANEIQVNKYNG